MAISKNEHIAQLTELAKRMDGKLKKAYLAAIQKLKDKNVDWAKIQSFLNEGRPDMVMDYLSTSLIQNSFNEYAKTLTEAFLAGGELAARLAPYFTNPNGVEVKVVFNAVNPALSGAMHEYQMQAITGLSEDIRASIRAILQRTISQGINPKEAAREIRSLIGLTSGQLQAVENYRKMLENQPLQALNYALRDKRFDRAVTSADLKQMALKPEQIDKMVARYTERFINYRATTIARTESIRALNMANYELWKSYVDSGQLEESRIIRKWIYSQDDRTRAAHDGRRPEGITSMNPDGVGLNEPFKSVYGDIMYPGDPNAAPENTINCRCTVFTRIRSY